MFDDHFTQFCEENNIQHTSKLPTTTDKDVAQTAPKRAKNPPAMDHLRDRYSWGQDKGRRHPKKKKKKKKRWRKTSPPEGNKETKTS